MPLKRSATEALADWLDETRLAALGEAELTANYARDIARLAAGGRTAVAEWLDFLAGPPRPVRHTADGRAIGAKLLVLAALAPPALDGDDVRRLHELAVSATEPAPVWLAAAELWLRCRGEEAVPELVRVLLDHLTATPQPPDALLVPFGAHLPAIVRSAIGFLYDREQPRRLAAKQVLIAIGPPAIALLVDLVQSTEDRFARAQAEEALGRIDPAVLSRALAGGPVTDR